MYRYATLKLHHDYLIVTTETGALAFVGSPDAGLAEAERRGFAPLTQAEGIVAPALRQVQALMTGAATRYTRALALPGTEFQHRVWAALRQIPYGQTCTYSELAQALGRPTAVRAVASAVAKNPAMVAVPCHRVVPKAGGVGQFRGGRAMKQALLAVEAGAHAEL